MYLPYVVTLVTITRESIVGFGRNITEKVSNQKCPGCFLLRHSVVVVVSECVQSSCFAPLNNMSVIFSVWHFNEFTYCCVLFAEEKALLEAGCQKHRFISKWSQFALLQGMLFGDCEKQFMMRLTFSHLTCNTTNVRWPLTGNVKPWQKVNSW